MELARASSADWLRLIGLSIDAAMALGELKNALESTQIHRAWLWREMTRTSCKISQLSGHRVKVGTLRRHLASLPIEADENNAGLAAARRVFLVAASLLQIRRGVDSKEARVELFEPLWGGEPMPADNGVTANETDPKERAGEKERLEQLVADLTAFAGNGARPVLIDLLMELSRHAIVRQLPASLARLALPLALHQSGLVPKAVPTLLGGRLSLTPAATVEAPIPVAIRLERALADLAGEADRARRRLADLERQHHAWRARLASARLHGHAKAPLVLDLLAATPVISMSLVRRHLGCSHVAAGKIVRRLVNLEIVTEVTSRARHKIFLAGDLGRSKDGQPESEAPLSFSVPRPSVDIEAIEATLDGLFADLDRLNERVRTECGVANTVDVDPT